MSAKPTPKSSARKPSAKPLRKRGTPGAAGTLTNEEKTNLVLAAKDAFTHQQSLGRIEPGTNPNDWRRDQVEDLTGLAGTSKLNRSHFRTVKAHFLTLAGREDQALKLLTTTGVKSYRPTGPDDTWETAETYVANIRAALSDHCVLATHSVEQLTDTAAAAWASFSPSEPFPGLSPKILAAKAALDASNGYIRPEWLLHCARQRTNKLGLKMETLAERLAPETLSGLLSHLRNHISKREGRATDRRAPRRYPKPADPGEMDAPF